MPQQDAMRVQRALGLARGARRIDDDGGVVCRGANRGVVVGLGGQRRMERHRAALAFAINAIDDLKVRQAGADFKQLAAALGVGPQRRRAAVGQPVLDGVHAEQREQRHRHRAHLVDGDVRHRGLGRLRQIHRHAVAAPHPVALQAVREAVGLRLDVVEGIARLRAVALFVDQRHAPAAVGPFVAGVDADIEVRRHLPLELGHKLLVGFGSGQHGLVSDVVMDHPGLAQLA
ncbi:hypothetical protein G6F50_013904 [Rhizopus delemar]|uniref:Uncharacterized protein n=1 Tax=Rhizopus delemar TaxID=936053 RepID=A0A9P7CAU2_9FUNG|nr:hypothetical protein G6F50_013904 [Rhizopus delemar]